MTSIPGHRTSQGQHRPLLGQKRNLKSPCNLTILKNKDKGEANRPKSVNLQRYSPTAKTRHNAITFRGQDMLQQPPQTIYQPVPKHKS